MSHMDNTADAPPPSLSADSRAAIERECAKYPHRASALMSALRIAQEEHGWLSQPLIELVAEVVGVPAIRAMEVATFYNMYDLKPVGRHKLCLCTNLPCALVGADDTAAELKKQLGVEWGGTTEDGEFTLKEGECFGACGDGPVVIVNNRRMRAKITADKVGAFLDDLRAGGGEKSEKGQ